MKRGYLERKEDVSGVTGTGEVAEFTIASDGRVVVFWPIGVGVWPSLEELIKVHGHNGKTIAVVLDDPDVGHCMDCHFTNKSNSLKCQDHEICPACIAGVPSD